MRDEKIWYGPACYQIKVKGRLGSQWSDWLEGMTVTCEGGMTILTGGVTDQSALHGLLMRIHDLGMQLISVNRIEEND